MLVAWLAALAIANPPDVAALRDADRAGEAEYAARVWLSADPDDAARWVLLGDALADPTAGETLYREALRIEPGYPPAWEGLGRAYLAAGARDLAVEAFERALAGDPANEGAAIGRAEAARDLALAEALRAQFPESPRAALLVARLAPERALDVLTGDAPAIRLSRADVRLARGENPADDLAGLQGAEADRLRRWAGCVAAGTVDGSTYAAFAETRRQALIGAPVDPVSLVGASSGCSASHAIHAAILGDRGDRAGALAAWCEAFVLAPGDSGIAASLGHALRVAGARDEAVAILAHADPADPDVALDLAAIARSNGDLPGAVRILAAAEAASPWAVRLVLARVAVTPRAERLNSCSRVSSARTTRRFSSWPARSRPRRAGRPRSSRCSLLPFRELVRRRGPTTRHSRSWCGARQRATASSRSSRLGSPRSGSENPGSARMERSSTRARAITRRSPSIRTAWSTSIMGASLRLATCNPPWGRSRPWTARAG